MRTIWLVIAVVALLFKGLSLLVEFLQRPDDFELHPDEAARFYLVLGAGGVVLLLVGLFALRRRFWPTDEELIRVMEAVAIADFPLGTDQRVVGRVSLEGELLRAPLSGRSCVAYSVWVYEHVDGSGSGLSIREQRSKAFMLTDATGRVRIDPTHVTMVLGYDHCTRSGLGRNAGPAEEAFLAARLEKSKGWIFNRSIEYYEGVIEPGDEVSVAGHGFETTDRDAAGKPILELRGTADDPLAIGNSPELLRAPAVSGGLRESEADHPSTH